MDGGQLMGWRPSDDPEDSCQPRQVPFPSGPAFAHSRSCPRFPGQKISPAAPWHHTPEVCEHGNRACTPQWRADVGHLVHESACPVKPGEVVSSREYAKGRRW